MSVYQELDLALARIAQLEERLAKLEIEGGDASKVEVEFCPVDKIKLWMRMEKGGPFCLQLGISEAESLRYNLSLKLREWQDFKRWKESST